MQRNQALERLAEIFVGEWTLTVTEPVVARRPVHDHDRFGDVRVAR
jgi:hypothetical protein